MAIGAGVLSAISLGGVARSEEHTLPLFEGDSLRGWTRVDGRPPASGWRLKDGVLHLDLSEGRAGHLLSERRFGDFRLTFEWKIAGRGNSGLKYRVRRYKGRLLGCEYQLLDDPAYGSIHPKHTAGALYALYEPSRPKQLRPAGEYNTACIEVIGDRVRHWLNGQRIVNAEVGSDDWRRRVAISKFAEYDGFGQNPRGKADDHRPRQRGLVPQLSDNGAARRRRRRPGRMRAASAAPSCCSAPVSREPPS